MATLIITAGLMTGARSFFLAGAKCGAVFLLGYTLVLIGACTALVGG